MRWFKAIIILFFCFTSILFLYTYLFYPEGVKVVSHYVFGRGEKYKLTSNYIPKSPVVIGQLNKMEVGQVKIVSFKQYEDWRLSYALNPFELKKMKYGFQINQYIKFDSTGNVYTIINLLGIKIKVYDNWVNFLGTQPYDLTYEYDNRLK